MADNKNFKDELGQIRQRIQQKKESSKLTQLFKGAGPVAVPQKEMKAKKIIAVREVEEDRRIVGAVRELLDIIPKKLMDKVEAKYPKTMAQLFEVSERVIEGGYGQRLQVAGRSQSSLIIDWDVMLALLTINACKSLHPLEESEVIPEILESMVTLPQMTDVDRSVRSFNDRGVEKIALKSLKTREDVHRKCHDQIDGLISQVVLDRMERQVLLRFFRQYLNSLANPSHVSVNMRLKKGQSVDKTVKAAMSIKSKTERSKSISNIVGNLFSTDRVDQAIRVVGSIKAKKEKGRPLTDLVNRLLNPKRRDIDQLIKSHQIDEAIDMVKALTDPKERDKILQRIVSGLGKHELADKALEVARAISDSDTKAFALSSMVSALVSVEVFDRAMEVAALIDDPDFREDALGYIVRGLMGKKSLNEVIAFVDGIEDPIERKRAAKIILSSVIASRNKANIVEVCTHFALVK